MRYVRKTLPFLVLAGALAALSPSAAWAQAAGDVACDKCVDSRDLANKAVVERTIKKRAVKGNRIAAGAVDAAALAAGAVTESKLGVGAVSAGKIADLAVGPAALASEAVTEPAIADGAVTGDKLPDGAVTSSRLAPGGVTSGKLAAAAVRGDKVAGQTLTDTEVAAGALDANVEFAQLVVVTPVGPTPSDNCAALQNVLTAINDASASKPYVIKVEPGVYDCGSTTVVMKPFVDIEGSGEGVTTIHGDTTNITGVVRGADNTELRFLTVEHEGGVSDARAIFSNAADFSLRQVTAISQNASMFVIGIAVAGSARLTDVTARATSNAATASALAVFIANTTAELVNVIATASGPGTSDALRVQSPAGIATAKGSVFAGTHAVRALNDAVGNFVASQLDGNVTLVTGGTVSCVKAYDAGFMELSPACL